MNNAEVQFGPTGLCPHGNFASSCPVCAEFASGSITAEFLKQYWQNPEAPLFQTALKARGADGTEKTTAVEARGLTAQHIEPLLNSLKDAWGEYGISDLQDTLAAFQEQREKKGDFLLNVEYYVLLDLDTGQPFAMTGLYSEDVRGGTGLATQGRLDPEKHFMATGLGWFAVSPQYRGRGAGKFLLDWTEAMAKSRGAEFMYIETDTDPNEKRAVKMYEDRGYQIGFHTDDFFGPGRNLDTYFADISKDQNEYKPPTESIGQENQAEVLKLAHETFDPERFAEFEAVLQILLSQPQEAGILKAQTFVQRGQDGNLESFGIVCTGVYDNVLNCYWYGSRAEQSAELKMNEALKALAKTSGREVIVVFREGQDNALAQMGFEPAGKEGIPNVYAKGDPTKFLFYTKKLT